MIVVYALASPQTGSTSLKKHWRKQEFLVVSITVMSITEMKELKYIYIHSTYNLHLNGRCACFDVLTTSEFSLYLKLETNNCIRNTFSTKSSTSSIYFSTVLGIRQREQSIKKSDWNHSCTKNSFRFAHNRPTNTKSSDSIKLAKRAWRSFIGITVYLLSWLTIIQCCLKLWMLTVLFQLVFGFLTWIELEVSNL